MTLDERYQKEKEQNRKVFQYIHEHMDSKIRELYSDFDNENYYLYEEEYDKYEREYIVSHPEAIIILRGDISKYTNDKEIIKIALEQKEFIGEYLPDLADFIWRDRELLKMLCEQYGETTYNCVPLDLQDDKDVIKYALKDIMENSNDVYDSKENIMKHISDDNSNDKEIMTLAVQGTPELIEYASENLKDDKELVINAINSCPIEDCINDGLGIRFISERLKNDKDIILSAVKKDGLELEYSSPDLKDDKEVVLAAVNECGGSLEYASDRLKDDEEVVLAALKNTLDDFDLISERLKNDKDFILKAVAIDEGILEYINPELRSYVQEYFENLQLYSNQQNIENDPRQR